jgi:hypothetical protein
MESDDCDGEPVGADGTTAGDEIRPAAAGVKPFIHERASAAARVVAAVGEVVPSFADFVSAVHNVVSAASDAPPTNPIETTVSCESEVVGAKPGLSVPTRDLSSVN